MRIDLKLAVLRSGKRQWRIAPEVTKAIYAGFLRLLGIKWLYEPRKPSVYARSFIQAWCRVTEAQARQGIAWLRGRGYMRVVGRNKRSGYEWLPGTAQSIQEAKRNKEASGESELTNLFGESGLFLSPITGCWVWPSNISM